MLAFLHGYVHTHQRIESRFNQLRTVLVRLFRQRRTLAPSRFEIRDSAGSIVACGLLPRGSREAIMRRVLWRCTAVDLPSYTVRLLDAKGRHIGTIHGRRAITEVTPTESTMSIEYV